jgi:hypothetical protein
LTAIVNFIVLLFLAPNVACRVLFRWRPDLLLSENERMPLDCIARVEGKLEPHIPDWFAIAATDGLDLARRLIDASASG